MDCSLNVALQLKRDYFCFVLTGNKMLLNGKQESANDNANMLILNRYHVDHVPRCYINKLYLPLV